MWKIAEYILQWKVGLFLCSKNTLACFHIKDFTVAIIDLISVTDMWRFRNKNVFLTRKFSN